MAPLRAASAEVRERLAASDQDLREVGAVIARRNMEMRRTELRDDPQWYKGRRHYELRVRPFMDSNGTAWGLSRLTSKLDYLQDWG